MNNSSAQQTMLLINQDDVEAAIKNAVEKAIAFGEQKLIEAARSTRIDWITEPEAVKLLGFKEPQQVRKLADKRKIKRSHPDGTKKIYYSLTSIIKYIETGTFAEL
jgi:hypothetical protein